MQAGEVTEGSGHIDKEVQAAHELAAAFAFVPDAQAVGIAVADILIHPVGIVVQAFEPRTEYCFEPIRQVNAVVTELVGVVHALPKIKLDHKIDNKGLTCRTDCTVRDTTDSLSRVAIVASEDGIYRLYQLQTRI